MSNPHVMTSENKKAVINVSTSVPIVTGQQTSTVSAPGTTAGSTNTSITTGGVNQTVEYRDAGVVLTVTPRIGERGTVALDVKQEVNSVGPTVPPTNSPSFVKREAETSVVLLNNQTLVLGGLIQDKVTVDDRGIPLLKNIPILGYLFGFKEKKIEKTELLLLITPRVIGTALDAARITEEMRRTTPELNRAIRNAPRSPVQGMPPGTAPVPEPAPLAPPVAPAPAVPVPPAVAPVPAIPPPPGPSGVPPIPGAPPPGPSGLAPPNPVVLPPPLSVAPPAPASPQDTGSAAVPPAPGVIAPAPADPATARPIGPPARQTPRSGLPVRPRMAPQPTPDTPAAPPPDTAPKN